MAFGGTVKLTGESAYKKALADITSNLKVLNSEMKVVTSQFDKNDKSTSNLSQQNDVLNKKIAEQKDKVSILAKALADAESETGKNSSTSQKWRIELNNAQAELNKLNKNVDDNKKAMADSEKATEDNTDAIDKFGKEADESGKSALKLGDIIKGNLISEGIMTGIKGLASAIKGVGSAFVNVGKQAIASYGEYEQLVGGVDTLFGESSKKVQDYAKNAYMTAGLSANQYMETVTSFSASLLQSLDGDTSKSAEIANMAITDMSDNANKMGTSMESIQNAYQGFAKQNWTMLDNLKLGYGGTAREMARLVNESGVLGDNLIDLDDKQMLNANLQEVGYAKIIEAVHKVQQEMGITGTTSLEASKTITGSTSAMKGAWQNLITGIADDNANFQQLVDNLVVSIIGKDGEGGVLTNILPRIEIALDGIVQMVVSLTETLLPQIMQIAVDLILNLVQGISEGLPTLLESAKTILNTIIEGIVTVMPTLIPVVMQMLTTLITTILENLPLILEMGIQMLTSLVQGIADSLPEIIPVMINSVVLMVETLLDNIDLIIDTGIELIIALAEGLIYAIPDLIDKAPVIIKKLIGAFTENFPKIFSMAGELIGKMAVGLVASIPRLLTSIPEIIAQLVVGFKNYYSSVWSIGGNLVSGIWEGISGSLQWLKNKLTSWVGNVTDFIKRMFGINSPSRLFKEQIGTNLALGIGEGFGDTMHDVSQDMANAIPTEFDANIHTTGAVSSASQYDVMLSAFKQALKECKVVMNNREMGAFVTETVEREVFA